MIEASQPNDNRCDRADDDLMVLDVDLCRSTASDGARRRTESILTRE